MPAPFPTNPTPNSLPQPPPPYPALSLFPLNDTFIPKHIALPPGQKIKIGRQTNAKTAPGERNGYFDTKVLSRQHAEVWEENGKIYIRDVKSSNGTFINGERLSPEGVESEPSELKTDDIVEFGIDIVGEDNKTVIHHKVAARIACIITADDAAREQQQMAVHHHQQQQQQHFQSAAQGGQHPITRRPTLQPQLGGMGGPPRPKSTISLDHILSRLQGELNKSRETTNELAGLTSAMNEISDTLGGAVPPPTIPPSLPPVRAAAAPSMELSSSSSFDISSLHNELSDTKSTLASQAEKVRELESVLSDHEIMKREVKMLRDLVQEKESNAAVAAAATRVNGTISLEDEEEEDNDPDADVRSIRTLRASGDEDEEEDDDDEPLEERRRRRTELGRPRTPEPGMVLRSTQEEQQPQEEEPAPLSPPPSAALADDLLATLTSRLETAIELTQTLAAQHTAAQETIRHLEDKVLKLESIEEKVNRLERESKMLSMLDGWKEGWEEMKEDWASERKRLNGAREEFEKRLRSVEVSTTSAVLGASASASAFRSGLVTPPSPRSRSADSSRNRNNKRRGNGRKRRGAGGVGGTREDSSSLSEGDAVSASSTSPLHHLKTSVTSPSSPLTTNNNEEEEEEHEHENNRSSSPSPASSTAFEEDSSSAVIVGGGGKGILGPLTPDSSYLHEYASDQQQRNSRIIKGGQPADITLSTMFGCVIVTAAAVAVYWRTHE